MFFCNSKPGLIREIPISSRDILPESILWGSWWRAALMGGVSVSNSNPAPLLSTGPINVSAIGSAQLQSKGGGGACKHKEQGNSGRQGRTWRAGFVVDQSASHYRCSPLEHGSKLSAQGQINRRAADLLWGSPEVTSERNKEKHGRQS